MAVGAARPSMTEMDSELMNQAKVVVDSRAGAVKESGDVIKSGCKIKAELGELVNDGGFEKGGLTIFKSLGMAVQDLVAGDLISKKLNSNLFSEPPFKCLTDDDIAKILKGALPCFKIKTSETVISEVESEFVKFQVKSICLAETFLVCSIESQTKENGSKACQMTLVYSSKFGDLLTITKSKLFHDLDLGKKFAILNRIFD